MPLTGIEHLLVLTDDIDATRDFYVEALGLREGERPPLEFPGYWLYLDEVPTVHVAERLAFSEHSDRIGIPAAAPADSTGAVDHIAFNGTGYDALRARLRGFGLEPAENEVPGIGMRQLFVEDPNGLKIEINVMPGRGHERQGDDDGDDD
jgi:catechol 2,3-dioxygenase-like lactoylglutathione lyase family enzyme